MKKLKFENALAEKIIQGEKNTTWRVNDDKNLSIGDEILLIRKDGAEFGKAVITNVAEKKFKELDQNDWGGHEKFSSEKEMYETYSKYYGFSVGPDHNLKIIKFKII